MNEVIRLWSKVYVAYIDGSYGSDRAKDEADKAVKALTKSVHAGVFSQLMSMKEFNNG